MKEDMITRLHDDVLIERNYNDGIFQITGGSTFIIFSLLNLIGYGGVFIFLIIPILTRRYLIKKYTYPRIGYAKLWKNDQFGITWSQFIFYILAYSIFSYFALIKSGVFHQTPHILLFSAMIFFYITDIIVSTLFNLRKRKVNFVYILSGVIMCAFWVLAFSPDWFNFRINTKTFFLVILGINVLNLIYGIEILRTFIKKYPILENEDK